MTKKSIIFSIAIFLLVLIVSLILIKRADPTKADQPKLFQAPSNSLFLYQSAEEEKNFQIYLGNRERKNKPNAKFRQGDSWINFSLEKEAKTIESNDQELIYQNVWPGISIVYRIIDNGLKEDVVVDDFSSLVSLFPNQEAVFTFTADLENAVLKDQPSSLFVFVDPQTEEYRFHFEKPFMVDANGQRSEDVILTITPNENKENNNNSKKEKEYLIKLIPSWEWLSDPSRAYPVFIDPTIVYNQGGAFWSGTRNRTGNEGDLPLPDNNTQGIKYQEMAVDSSTVGLWRMNNDWQDSSGLGHGGTAQGGATFTDQAKVSSFSGNFTGPNDHVVISTSLALAPERTFTLEAWVWPNSLSTDASWGDAIVQREFNSRGYQMTWHQDGRFGCVLGNGSSTTIDFGLASKGLFEWYHVACVYDGTNIKVYVNGILESVNQRNYLRNTTESVWLGSWSGGRNFNGHIDEVRISNVARTSREIRHNAQRRPSGIYTSEVIDLGEFVVGLNSLSWSQLGTRTGDGETPFSSTGLLADWRFNEASGTTTSDSSGGGNHGTLTNFANTSGRDFLAGSGWTSNNRRWGAGALMFDGANDFVNLGERFNSLTLPFSIEGWIFLNGRPNAGTVGESWSSIFNSDNHSGSYFGTNLHLGPTNHLMISYGDGTGPGPTSRRSYGGGRLSVPIGQWTHVAAVVRGPLDMEIYINGVEVNGQYSGTGGNMVTSTSAPAQIGLTTLYGPMYMNGAIDSLRLYSRSLSKPEIISNYQAGIIEFQTRTGATNTPNDGSWEGWRPINNEAQLLNLDADTHNWLWGNNALLSPLIKTNSNNIKMEGTGSLNLASGARSSDANTVGLWSFEETSGAGAFLKDGSASVADLTPSGTTVTNGFFGKARHFSGGSHLFCLDSVCGGTNRLDVTGSLTIEAWVRHDSITSIAQTIVSKWFSGTSGSYFFQVRSGFVEFSVQGATQATRQSSIALQPFVWTHVAGIYNASTQTLDVYINGELRNGTITGTIPASLSDSSADFFIGIGSSGAITRFFGTIDEVRIMALALNPEAIAESHRAGQDHRLTRIFSATNFSDKNKFSFDIASDRTGTFLEAIIGESSFANHQPDSNTVGLWRFADNSEVGISVGERLTDTSGYPTTQLFGGLSGGWASGGCSDTSSNQALFLDQYPSPGDSFGGRTWQTATSASGNFNLDAIICGGDCNNVYAYSHIYLYSPLEQTIRFRWGSDDASQVWVNGVLVATVTTCQGVNIDQFQTDVLVEKGWNRVLWRVAEGGGGFGLAWRITDTSNNALRMVYRLTRPINIKDETLSNNHGLSAGTQITGGKFDKGRTFDGTSDYIAIPDSASLRISSYTVSVWIYANQQNEAWKGIVGKPGRNYHIWLGNANGNAAFVHHRFASTGGGTNDGCPDTRQVIRWGEWNHIVITNNGVTCRTYVNGKEEASGNVNGSLVVHNTTTYIGKNPDGPANSFFRGIIDEVRIDNIARSAEEIRQLYELDKRSHSITIDFASSLNASDIGGTSEASARNDTVFVLPDNGMIHHIFPAETVILRENYNGVFHVLQGIVTNVNTGTRTIAVASWGGSVPNQGSGICGGSNTHCFSPNASVFKWQREWFDLSGPLPSHLDGVTQISLRLINGWEGRSVWVDDFRTNQSYLNNPSGSAINSTVNRYFQFRAIFSTTDTGVSPLLTGTVNLDYDILEPPSNCLIDDSRHPGQLIVRWQDNSLTETGYQVVRTRQEGPVENTFNLPSNSNSYTDTGIEANFSYQYRIRAERSGVFSAWCHTPIVNLGVGGFRFEGLRLEGVTLD